MPPAAMKMQAIHTARIMIPPNVGCGHRVAQSAPARLRGTAKWALRSSLHRLARPLARRLFTVHYACLCVPAPGPPR